MKNRINPVGLKGREVTDRMKELMGIAPINENRKTSVVELTKLGPDGNVYGIVRENHQYFIKITSKKENLIAEDFKYIGSLKNKTTEAYPSYAKALKHLNLKFNSLNETYGGKEDFNMFKNDNLLNENMAYGFKNEGNLEDHAQSECCHSPIQEGKCSSCGGVITENEDKNNPWAICTAKVGREDKAKYEACVKDVKKEHGITEEVVEEEEMEDDALTEIEQAVDDMLETTDMNINEFKAAIDNLLGTNVKKKPSKL
jgi:hypothetical protein